MTIGSHQQTVGKSQAHLTPRHIVQALGDFDLDPCAADPRPWDCATHNLTEADDGLKLPWHGRVWLNPPFDRYVVGEWLQRLAYQGNGIALLHARTETGWFEVVWQCANALLFLADRQKFCRADGTPQPANSGAPLVLAAFGRSNVTALRDCGLPGFFIKDWTSTRGKPPCA